MHLRISKILLYDYGLILKQELISNPLFLSIHLIGSPFLASGVGLPVLNRLS